MSFAIILVNQFMNNFTKDIVYRILRYLKMTLGKGFIKSPSTGAQNFILVLIGSDP